MLRPRRARLRQVCGDRSVPVTCAAELTLQGPHESDRSGTWYTQSDHERADGDERREHGAYGRVTRRDIIGVLSGETGCSGTLAVTLVSGRLRQDLWGTLYLGASWVGGGITIPAGSALAGDARPRPPVTGDATVGTEQLRSGRRSGEPPVVSHCEHRPLKVARHPPKASAEWHRLLSVGLPRSRVAPGESGAVDLQARLLTAGDDPARPQAVHLPSPGCIGRGRGGEVTR